MGLKGFARRILYHLQYHLVARRRLSRDDAIRLFDFSLVIPQTVFHPSLFHTSRFLGEYISSIDLRGISALDIGCGSGIISLIAARAGASVAGVDINPKAVEATRNNAARNNLAKSVIPYLGDLYEPVANRRFDYVFMNPPFYPGEPKDPADHAWRSGKEFDFLRRLARLSVDHLTPSGQIVYVLSSDADVEHISALLRAQGFSIRVLCTRRLLFETLTIFSATLAS